MNNVALSRVNIFRPSPKACTATLDDPILEIPLSEIEGILNEMVLTYNQIAETIKDAGILRRRPLAREVEKTSASIKEASSLIEKMQRI